MIAGKALRRLVRREERIEAGFTPRERERESKEGVALDIHSHHVCRPDHGKIPRLQPPHIPLHLAPWLRPDRAGGCWPALSSTASSWLWAARITTVHRSDSGRYCSRLSPMLQ